jgi:hypothetical protein
MSDQVITTIISTSAPLIVSLVLVPINTVTYLWADAMT